MDAISSVEDGRRRETLQHLRSIDKAGLERADRFYRAAYSFYRSRQDAGNIYFVFVSVVSAIVFIYATGSLDSIVLIVFLYPFVGSVMLPALFPFWIYFFKRCVESRASKIQRLLDHDGFSFQEVLALRQWLDQQDWHDRKLKDRLGHILNAQMARLENMATAPDIQPFLTHALGKVF